MAKPGVRSGRAKTNVTGAATRSALIDAAVESLKAEGFAGTSARSIATRAGCAQGLVFYHFGSVVELLLAALDAVSARRLDRYRSLVAAATTPPELLAAAAAIFREDMAGGDAAVLVEMIAGASATPGLGAEVMARIVPWREFAAEAIASGLAGSPLSVVPVGDLSHAVIALYLGLEMLSHLEADETHADALSLFDQLGRLAQLLAALFPPTDKEPGST